MIIKMFKNLFGKRVDRSRKYIASMPGVRNDFFRDVMINEHMKSCGVSREQAEELYNYLNV